MTDVRVAGAGARFGAPEVAVAHNMGWHSVPRLVRLVGVSATRRVLIAGEEWNADEAKALGFEPSAVYVEHPIQDRTDAEMLDIAEQAFEAVIVHLLKQS